MNLDVRAGTADDLGPLNDLYNHYIRTGPITFDIEEIDLAARRRWFESFDTTGRYRLLVAVDADVLLGYATSKAFRDKQAYETSVETTVYCAHDQTGRGVGTALYTALFDELAAQDVHRAYAGITMPNAASVALHERFGFRQVAYFSEQGRKNGRYWDVAWYEKAL